MEDKEETKNENPKTTESESKTEDEKSVESVHVVKEGQVNIEYHKKFKVFYNPTQEFNRDISVVGIQAFIKSEAKEKENVSILELMSASGIRAIRYAKEIDGVKKVIANDLSRDSIESIKLNSKINETENIVEPSLRDARTAWYLETSKDNPAPLVVDLDPYGTPVPFLDSAIQTTAKDGLLLVTATDLAILSGNHAETCFAKYGSMPLKSKACHELALRILIHTVQNTANKYGRYVEPLLSLKIDFYIRVFFRVLKSPQKAKDSCAQTSMVYQCTGCRSFKYQNLAIRKDNYNYGFALTSASMNPTCSICNMKYHVGGPIWTGLIHNTDFVNSMLENLHSTHKYLNTFNRINGMLNMVLEELDVPLLYSLGELSSIIKSSCIPLLTFKSAIMNLGYDTSLTHVSPNCIKTNAPANVLWDILLEWKKLNSQGQSGSRCKEGSTGYIILEREIETKNISFEIREDANPQSRERGCLRYQVNPTKYWGPGVRNYFHQSEDRALIKQIKNQGKRKHAKAGNNGEECNIKNQKLDD